MDEHNFEDIIRDDVNVEIRRQIYKCMKIYGIEGFEDKIKELYQLTPTIQNLFLTEYRKILKG